MAEQMIQSWFVQGMVKATTDLSHKGWGERNAGNVSLRLVPEDLEPYQKLLRPGESRPIGETIPGIAGQYFMITGAGKFFRNVQLEPEEALGLLRVSADGATYQMLWGFRGGAVPTSELSSHLKSQEVRQRVTGGRSRVIMHCHATNLIALTYVLEPSSPVITRALWEGTTECLVLLPEGVGVLPWMPPGTAAIGAETARAMERHSLILWPFHGVLAAGGTLDEAFGLIDTAEKSAEVLVKVLSMGGFRQTISKQDLLALAARHKITPMREALDLESWGGEADVFCRASVNPV